MNKLKEWTLRFLMDADTMDCGDCDYLEWKGTEYRIERVDGGWRVEEITPKGNVYVNEYDTPSEAVRTIYNDRMISY